MIETVMTIATQVASIAIILAGLVVVLAACVALSAFLFVRMLRVFRIYKDFAIYQKQKARHKWRERRAGYG